MVVGPKSSILVCLFFVIGSVVIVSGANYQQNNNHHQTARQYYTYWKNQPSLYYNGINRQKYQYFPQSLGHANFLSSQLHHNAPFYGFSGYANGLNLGSVLQRGYMFNPFGMSTVPYGGSMFQGGYGSAFYGPYPQESLTDKANNFIVKNWPLLLAGGALFAVIRG